MSRVVFGLSHFTDRFGVLQEDVPVRLQWVDSYGAHEIRVTEDLPAPILAAVKALLTELPDIRYWQIEKEAGAVVVSALRDGQSSPVVEVLTASRQARAVSILAWADGEVDVTYQPKNDLYEEEQAIGRDRERMNSRERRFRARSR